MAWQHVLGVLGRQLESEGGDQSDQDSFHEQDTPDDSLPPYESLEDLAPWLQDTPSNVMESDSKRAQQRVPDTFLKYGYNPAWGSLTMILVQRPSAQTDASVPWAAALCVKCDDVARLMREGFFWSVENVLPEEGCLSDNTDSQWLSLGFSYARTWTLIDKSNGDDPRWVAQLDVLTRFPELLSGFEIQNLSRRNVWSARAWNPFDQLVYHYDYSSSGRNCNCIYGDRPLQGWWPWPRRSRHLQLLMFWARRWGEVRRERRWKYTG